LQIVRTRRNQLIVLCLFAGTGRLLAADPGFTRLREDGQLVYYSGTATLHGKVERRTDPETAELVGDSVCFNATGSSIARIPRQGSDARAPRFCFESPRKAMKLLMLPDSPRRGTCGYQVEATLRIENYVVNRQESEVSDRAELVAVIKRGALRDIGCL